MFQALRWVHSWNISVELTAFQAMEADLKSLITFRASPIKLADVLFAGNQF